MKPGLHRSIIFWSGLLVMVFVCWAWRDSELLWTKVLKGHAGIHHGWGGLAFSSNTTVPYTFQYDRRPTGNFRHSPETFPAPLFLRARDLPKGESSELLDRLIHPSGGTPPTFTRRELMTISVGGGPPQGWSLFIPHWLILLAVAAAWLALLFWRARRRAAAIKPLP